MVPRNELFRVENIFRHHEYAFPLNCCPHRPLRVMDIGANVGLFAIYVELIAPQSVIHCYEPVPASVSLLRNNTVRYPEIHIHPYGLAECNGTATIHLHPYNSGENSIRRSFGPETRKASIQLKEAISAFRETGFERLDILKVDTEGCEVEILSNLGLHLSTIRIVLVEYHSESDRRRIDTLLPGHTLFGAKVSNVAGGIGILKYIRLKE